MKKNINLNHTGISELPNDLPESVQGEFDCGNNIISSLVGSPKKIKKSFDCSKNKLTNLIGGPVIVGTNYWCNNNHLTSLCGLARSLFFLDCRLNFGLLDVSDIWNSDFKKHNDVNCYYSLNKNMAILPLINVFAFCEDEDLNDIIVKHTYGKEKEKIIDFQYDLIENGYGEYARWKP